MDKKLPLIFIGVFISVIIIWYIASRIGFLPRTVTYCNGMLGLDYNAAVDGLYNYVELPTFKIVARCGGYCMANDCSNSCPPPNWTCK